MSGFFRNRRAKTEQQVFFCICWDLWENKEPDELFNAAPSLCWVKLVAFTFRIHLCIATRGLSPQQNIHETMNWRSYQPTQAHTVTTPIPTPHNTHYIAGTHYPPTWWHYPLRRTAAMFQPNNKNQCQQWEQLVVSENPLPKLIIKTKQFNKLARDTFWLKANLNWEQ